MNLNLNIDSPKGEGEIVPLKMDSRTNSSFKINRPPILRLKSNTKTKTNNSVSFDKPAMLKLGSTTNTKTKRPAMLRLGSKTTTQGVPFPIESPSYKTPTVIRKKRQVEEDSKKRKKDLKNFQESLLKKGECIEFTKEEKIGEGGFGVTARKEGYIHKLIKKFVEPYILVPTKQQWDWVFNRYKNFTNDMVKYSTNTRKLFPNNFIKITKNDGGYCVRKGTKSPHIYLRMPLIENMIKGDFKSNLGKLTEKELLLLIAQVYYIAIKTNEQGLYHNDLKPANIVIKKAEKSFTYNSLVQDGKKLILKVKKGDLIPVVIDYDLVSFVHFQDEYGVYDFPASGSSSDDYDYFRTKMQEYLSRKKKSYNEDLGFLGDSPDTFDINEAYEAFKKTVGEDRVVLREQSGGKRKSKRKKVKKIRKHKGINQETGRLKRGYKYTGRKLKSGLPEIRKIKK